MTETATAGEKTETVDEFAARARTWLADNMPPIDPDDPPVLTGLESTLATVAWRDRVYVLELGARPREVPAEEVGP